MLRSTVKGNDTVLDIAIMLMMLANAPVAFVLPECFGDCGFTEMSRL